MDPILAGMIIVLSLAYIMSPLFSSQKRPALIDPEWTASEADRVRQLAEKLEQAAAEKEDLEFMHEMGKLSDEDYRRLLEENTAEADALSGKMKVDKYMKAANEALDKAKLDEKQSRQSKKRKATKDSSQKNE